MAAVAALSSASTLARPTLTDILKGELDREFAGLKVKGDPAPYYMAYEVTEDQTDSASAAGGALIENLHQHGRGVDTTIRVGTPKFDNYHPYKGSRIRFTSLTSLSVDNDPNQIRRALWAETNRTYRSAARRLLQLRTDQELLAEEANQDADFSAEPAETYSQLPETYSYDMNNWAKKIRGWSAEFQQHPKILGSGVNFVAKRQIKTFVNTEGSSIEQGTNFFRIEINGVAVAPDGMDVRLFDAMEAFDPAHLPNDKTVTAHVEGVAKQLDALVSAPPAEPIVCPAILSGRASAVFFHEIFGHRVEGHRQKDINEGQTFKIGRASCRERV